MKNNASFMFKVFKFAKKKLEVVKVQFAIEGIKAKEQLTVPF